MKKVFLFLFILATQEFCFAQPDSVSLRLHLLSKTSSFYQSTKKISDAGLLVSVGDDRVEFGVGVQSDFHKYYSVKYSQAGAVHDTSHYWFITIPVVIKYNFSEKKFKPTASLGLFMYKKIYETSIRDEDVMARPQIQLSVGCAYSVSKKINVYVDCFTYASVLLYYSIQQNRFNNYFWLSIGVSYNFYKFSNENK
jgi:hypothetical protein